MQNTVTPELGRGIKAMYLDVDTVINGSTEQHETSDFRLEINSESDDLSDCAGNRVHNEFIIGVDLEMTTNLLRQDRVH